MHQLLRPLTYSCILFSLAAAGCAGPHLRSASSELLSNSPQSTSADHKRSDEASADTFENRCKQDSAALLFDKAKLAADRADYPLTHHFLTKSASLLESLNQSEAAAATPDSLLEQIVTLYLKRMPPHYLDSISEELALLAFQNQLTSALDSTASTPGDSLAWQLLTCQKTNSYDVPLHYNQRVLNALRFLHVRNKSSVERWLERADYYLPLMLPMFADSGLPLDLAYLPLIESGFNPKAYSFAHASGIWQFIPSTGTRYGLRQNFWIDERRDPIKSTRAAISYLRFLNDEFCDWNLALASYNCGEGGMRRAIRRSGTNDFWSLQLPQETMNYIPKYMAAVALAKNPATFGYTIPETESFSLDTVHVSTCIDLATIEGGIDAPPTTLKKLNPHILQWCTPPELSEVILYLPKGTREQFKRFAENLPEEQLVKWHRYRIHSGDNLNAIAKRFNIPLTALKSVNKLKNNHIVAGRYLLIPLPARRGTPAVATQPAVATAPQDIPQSAPSTPAPPSTRKLRYRVKAGETLWSIAEQFGVSLVDICRWNGITNKHNLKSGALLTVHISENAAHHNTTKSAAGSKRFYTVKKGDNLSSIATRLSVSISQLCAWNNKNLRAPIIYPGERLVYFTATSAASARGSEGGHYEVVAGDNLYRIALRFNTDVTELAQLNGISNDALVRVGTRLRVPSNSSSAAHQRTLLYKVKNGDNMWSIASSFGIPMQQLVSQNGLSEDSTIMPGDTLRIVVAEGM